MAYRPKYKNASGTLTDLPLEAETAVRLKNLRTIGLSGVTSTAQQFNGTSSIRIPVTAIPASLLEGTAGVDTTGTADKAKNYTAEGTIQSKFDAVDNAIGNIGKVKIGADLYQVRTTTNTADTGLVGYITFIL